MKHFEHFASTVIKFGYHNYINKIRSKFRNVYGNCKIFRANRVAQYSA